MAYAAVISLKHTIQRLENPINKPHITKSTYKELDSLRSMLKRLDDESSIMIDRSVINELDARIREAIWKVEDVLDESPLSLSISHFQGYGENSRSGSSETKSKRKVLLGFLKKKSCCLGLLGDETKMEMEMDSFLKTVKMLRKEYNKVLQKPLSERDEEEDEALSAAVPPVNNSTTVGLSDLSEEIINHLLWNPFETSWLPTVVSLVGMAGIGKTHLAALIYHHPRIVQYFDVRVWVRAGPKYQPNNIYADILSQLLHKPKDLFKEKSVDTLIDLLNESLVGRRYLIVLDNIWTTRVMDYLKLLNHIAHRDESRFLITTRLNEIGEHGSIPNRVQEMPFLNNEDSWNLLWQNVFVAENSFPPQLEKPGRKIAEKCEGLPLLILAVANILRGLDKTQEYWEKVAERKTTTFTDAYDQIYEVLLPSYEYLPQHLKPCFLYMGVFPQSCVIFLSKLINLWIVEDFLEPTQQQKLEEYAIECMGGLVSKSLAIVCKRSFIRIGSSKLHSAYWYLCVREAGKNKFFHVLNKLTDVSIEKHRRLAVQNNILFGIKGVYDTMAASTSTTRSLLFTGEDHQYPVPICFNMMSLMRVLDALAIRFYEFPNEVLNLLQLRYLALTHNGNLPSTIKNLQQLQFLILRQYHNIEFLTAPRTCLPEEIWDMQELRHLWIMGSKLLDPINGAKLPKLLRLYVNANSCTEAVFRSIPNLEKLVIKIELKPDSAENISCLEHVRVLNKLESLKCVVVNPRLQSQLAVVPPDHLSNLPETLKKLSLNGLGYSWKYMTAIGSLQCLQVLKLRCSAFQGPRWETMEGGFCRLEVLLLEDIDLVHWTAQDSRHNLCEGVYYMCFPRLHQLILRHCYKLKEIPSEIGDIPALEKIEVDDCSPSVVASAQQMEEERMLSKFQVVINSSWS